MCLALYVYRSHLFPCCELIIIIKVLLHCGDTLRSVSEKCLFFQFIKNKYLNDSRAKKIWQPLTFESSTVKYFTLLEKRVKSYQKTNFFFFFLILPFFLIITNFVRRATLHIYIFFISLLQKIAYNRKTKICLRRQT